MNGIDLHFVGNTIAVLADEPSYRPIPPAKARAVRPASPASHTPPPQLARIISLAFPGLLPIAISDAPTASVPDATTASVPDAPAASAPEAPAASVPEAPAASTPDAPVPNVTAVESTVAPDAPDRPNPSVASAADRRESRRAALVDRAVEAQRAKSRAEAAEARAIAEFAALVRDEHARHHGVDADDLNIAQGDLARRDAAAELAAATRISPVSAATRIEHARDLVERFPAVVDALEAARVTPQQARVIREEGTRITDATQRRCYTDIAIQIADSTGHTRLRSRAAKLAEIAMPETRTERHKRARDTRRIEIYDRQDGMCEFIAHIPTELGAGIHDRLSQAAKALKTPHEPRTYGQLLADVFCELALTGSPTPRAGSRHNRTGTGTGDGDGSGNDDDAGPGGGSGSGPGGGGSGPGGGGSGSGPGGGGEVSHACLATLLAGLQARISITIPVLSLLGVEAEPATLNGMTPIPMEDAMVIAKAAPSWTRVMTDPMTGEPLGVDTYAPSAAQRAFLEARDKHCRFPGCRRPARRCDVDHTREWSQDGKTDIANLAAACRGHHVMRHAVPWGVTQEPNGVLAWTAPSGRVYRDIPAPTGPIFEHSDLTRLLDRARARGRTRGRGHDELPGDDPSGHDPPKTLAAEIATAGVARSRRTTTVLTGTRDHARSLDPDDPAPF